MTHTNHTAPVPDTPPADPYPHTSAAYALARVPGSPLAAPDEPWPPRPRIGDDGQEPAPAAGPVTRYFTFGYGHTDPRTGASLAEHYATITAPDVEQCHAIMLALFGNQWAFPYDRRPSTDEVPLTEYVRVNVGAGPAQEPADTPD